MDQAEAFRALVSNPLKYRIFLLTKLPMAYLAGLRVMSIDGEQAQVSVPYTYLTKNPFGSIYFACLAMAAELSTGLLASMYTYHSSPALSMLVVGMETRFTKKARGRIIFQCRQGREFMQAVRESMETGESRTVRAGSTGTDEAGEEVAQFFITWSFKVKR